ncbi:MAG: aminotransferase class I/II-fold pyridoxal phosphate-dependent enzyme [Candidatus Peribacteraceae bacterium]|nr:aminotransferase class I/II-fold pyridoxal phosphate-dependent enzyme [Candidatus Peribacteraceae bacterium]
MDPTSLVRIPVRVLTGIQWGHPLPPDVLSLQFPGAPRVFPPILRVLRKELPLVNQYPEIATIDRVRWLMARQYGLTTKNVFLGSGVDALIDLVARTFIDVGNDTLLTLPTYPCYADAVKFMGGKVIEVPLEPDFSLNLDRFMEAITPMAKLIFIANPNYPIGNLLLALPQIETILKRFKGILVLDEEYVDFSGVTAVSLLKKYKNLIVMRGFSKSYGISGLRLGALYACEEIIRLLDNSQGATQVFEVNRLALAAGEAIMRNLPAGKKFVASFMARKKAFEKDLGRIPGIVIRPTYTPFTIFSTPMPAAEFRRKMLEWKIAMKSLAICPGVPENLIMTAVPSRKDVKRVLSAVRGVMADV